MSKEGRSQTALLVIDVQNDYCHPEGVFAKSGFDVRSIPPIYRNINLLVDYQRKKNAPVIWVKMIWDTDEEVGHLGERSPFLKHEGLRRGTWGAEIVHELDVDDEESIVEKKRFSAFYNTRIERVLQSLRVEKLIMTGVRTDFCVESSIRDAFFRDYEVVMVRDGVAGYIQQLHENSLKVMGTIFADVKNTEDILQDEA